MDFNIFKYLLWSDAPIFAFAQSYFWINAANCQQYSMCVQGKGKIETSWLLGEDNPDFPDLAPSSLWRHDCFYI